MDAKSIELIIAAIALLITIVTIAVNHGSRISVHENMITNLEDNFKLHESLNERAFSGIERELKEMNANIYKLLGYFEASKSSKNKNNYGN